MSPKIQLPSTASTEPAKANRRIAALALLGLLVLGGLACQHGRPESEEPSMLDPAARTARIEALRKEIARDHATLEDLITSTELNDQVQLHDNHEMRAIAYRLTEQVQALADLKAADAAAKAAARKTTRERTPETGPETTPITTPIQTDER